MPWKRLKGGGYTRRGAKRGGFISNPKMYEALRKQGMSKRKAARITNAKNK